MKKRSSLQRKPFRQPFNGEKSYIGSTCPKELVPKFQVTAPLIRPLLCKCYHRTIHLSCAVRNFSAKCTKDKVADFTQAWVLNASQRHRDRAAAGLKKKYNSECRSSSVNQERSAPPGTLRFKICLTCATRVQSSASAASKSKVSLRRQSATMQGTFASTSNSNSWTSNAVLVLPAAALLWVEVWQSPSSCVCKVTAGTSFDEPCDSDQGGQND